MKQSGFGCCLQVMKEQSQKSEAKLKQLFKENFQAGAKRHKALLAQQKVLQEWSLRYFLSEM